MVVGQYTCCYASTLGRHSGAIGELYAYDDLLGRRTATWSCQISGETEIDWGPTGPCKARTRHYDYYGLSQRVAMVRMSPFFWDEGYHNDGDNFEES